MCTLASQPPPPVSTGPDAVCGNLWFGSVTMHWGNYESTRPSGLSAQTSAIRVLRVEGDLREACWARSGSRMPSLSTQGEQEALLHMATTHSPRNPDARSSQEHFLTLTAFLSPLAGRAGAGFAGLHLAPATQETPSRDASQRFCEDSITPVNPFPINPVQQCPTPPKGNPRNTTAGFEPLIKVKKECKRTQCCKLRTDVNLVGCSDQDSECAWYSSPFVQTQSLWFGVTAVTIGKSILQIHFFLATLFLTDLFPVSEKKILIVYNQVHRQDHLFFF